MRWMDVLVVARMAWLARNRTGLALVLLVLGSTVGRSALASPEVRFTWGVGQYRWCPPASTDQPVFPGTRLQAYVTLIGHDAPHRDWRYELEMSPADGGAFPDAWRVDSLGCAAESGLTTYFQPPPIETCLRHFYSLAHPGSVIAPRMESRFDAATNRLRISVWVGIEPGHEQPNPAAVYVLGVFAFDHAQSVVGASDGSSTCGGVERPFCIRLVSASYLDPVGNWIPWAIDPSIISANGAGGPPCFVTPANSTTWGFLKVRYH